MKMHSMADDAGIEYEVHLAPREKTPGRDLVAFAEKAGAFELVVGFKERSALGEIMFGSNFRELIGNSPCPVVTVLVLA